MNHIIKAKILWFITENSNIYQKLQEKIYAANAEFEQVEGLWSVVLLLSKSEPIKMDNTQIINMAFLFPEHIISRIKKNIKFQIKEGPQKVIAEGIVLDIILDNTNN